MRGILEDQLVRSLGCGGWLPPGQTARSGHHGATGDIEDHAGDPGGVVGGQENRRSRHVCRGAEALERVGLAIAVCWAGGIRSRLRSVRIVSGAMQFTRIRYVPAWAATSWVSMTMAALAAA
jgi:hypothetical protein